MKRIYIVNFLLFCITWAVVAGVIYGFFAGFLFREPPPSVIDIEVPGLNLEIELPPKLTPVDSTKVPYRDYLRAACRIRDRDGGGGSGTCYKIDSEYVYVLTCRHVVKDKNRIIKEFWCEFWIDGRLTGEKKSYLGETWKILDVDAAIIRVPVNSFTKDELPFVIPISSIPPDRSLPIVSVGSPRLGWQTLFEGHIVKLPSDAERSFIFIPSPKGGRSGSGIIQGGKIVGVLWGRKDSVGDDSVGYGVSCMDLQELASKPSNYYFMADWCEFCVSMEPVVDNLISKGFDVKIVDFDTNRSLAKKFGVESLPAFVSHTGAVIYGVKSEKFLTDFYGHNDKGNQ